ncbi:hypothetical protein [Sphingopyxis sp. R3-92]|uniref:hypothetical protein n=1 Tax=Sphingopyxis sp. R3-92 TaxID=3158553 RepID=UPI003EE60DC1
MREFLTMVAGMLAFAVPGTAVAQTHGDRGGWSRAHDAPRGHDRDYRSPRHDVPRHDYDGGYRSNDRYSSGNDHRYERRAQKRRMHHHHRGRHWRG